MNLLLDTHTFLWFINGDANLSEAARKAIEDVGNTSFLSVGSLWEMAIKISLGKLTLAHPFRIFIPQQLQHNGIRLLDITVAHTVEVITLPLHHRDPFDRLLISQAIVEQMPVISRDASFDAYAVARIW
jgi:PIN domain nuclease of toxin-antitoxin system